MLENNPRPRPRGEFPFEDGPLRKLLEDNIEAKGLSRREIAFKMGYASPNVLGMYARGEAALPLERAIDLAQVLNIDLMDLVEVLVENYKSHPAWNTVATIMERLRPPDHPAAS